MPRLSVIICAHNEARWLGGCLHSVLAQTRPADEVVVVNNASSDETRTVAEGIAGVRIVDEPRKDSSSLARPGGGTRRAISSLTSTLTAEHRSHGSSASSADLPVTLILSRSRAPIASTTGMRSDERSSARTTTRWRRRRSCW
jgi:hypothetical protein